MHKPPNSAKDESDQSECSTKFYLPRSLLYPAIALLVAGAILIFSK